MTAPIDISEAAVELRALACEHAYSTQMRKHYTDMYDRLAAVRGYSAGYRAAQRDRRKG